MEPIAVLLPHNDKEMTRREAKDYLNEHIVTIDEIEKMAGLEPSPTFDAACRWGRGFR